MRILKILFCALVVMLGASAALAGPIQKGSNIFAIQLSEGDADLVGPESFSTGVNAGYLFPTSHSEMGVQAQFWHLVTDDYAFNLSAGVGFFSETDKPGDNALPGSEDFKYTQSSWKLRVGGDRVGRVGERFVIFGGPGIEYWSGKQKFDFGSSGSEESQPTNRIALSGRMGAHMALGQGFGLIGEIGHYWGYATAKDAGAQSTWWPSGNDGAMGFAFNF